MFTVLFFSACIGDSGGALVIEYNPNDASTAVQLGVVSWGAGCADKSYPGVYASVAMVRDWIDSTTV